MRNQLEINQAIAILSKNGDKASKKQIDVLKNRMTESQVFQTYVVNVDEESKDESLYFACRDAAQYLVGSLSIHDLTGLDASEIKTCNAHYWYVEEDTITLSRAEYDCLIERLDRLEQWTGLRRSEPHGSCQSDVLPQNADMKDMLTQNEACRYIGCSKNTIKKYVSRGLLHSYRQRRYTYYSKTEIDKQIKILKEGTK